MMAAKIDTGENIRAGYVRPKLTKGTIPARFSTLLSMYETWSSKSMKLVIDGIPPSVNHMYNKRIFKSKSSGKMRIHQALSDEARIFRIRTHNAFARLGKDQIWVPDGTLAMVVFFLSPRWTNKDMTPKKMDYDNRLKVLYDSMEKSWKIPDELIFEGAEFKVLSDKEQTVVHVFDLGVNVPYMANL